MVSKDVWGPSTWTLFHTLAEKVKEKLTLEHINLAKKVLKS